MARLLPGVQGLAGGWWVGVAKVGVKEKMVRIKTIIFMHCRYGKLDNGAAPFGVTENLA